MYVVSLTPEVKCHPRVANETAKLCKGRGDAAGWTCAAPDSMLHLRTPIQVRNEELQRVLDDL